MVLGAFMIYGALFAVGFAVYGNYRPAGLLAVVALLSGTLLAIYWKRLKAT
jgi:hypothetical protein